MEINKSENNVAKEKSSSLLNIPATFLKKISFNFSLSDRGKELEPGEHNNFEFSNNNNISYSLNELINNVEKIFDNDDVFNSVKELANEVNDISEANHVLLIISNEIDKLCNSNLKTDQKNLFKLPGAFLENFVFPEDYINKAAQLKNKCSSIQTELEFKSCLQNVIDLIKQVYAESEVQKQELEKFIFNVGLQISKIGDDLNSTVEKQTSDFILQNDLNEQMNNAVNGLNNDIASFTDLDTLKSSVKSQLDALKSLVDEERKVVKAHESRVKESVQVLAKKVDRLKMEAQELRERVHKEKENALRDPLTNMYNREAYDNKIKKLIKESKGNAKDLSLMLWDIDHFKKFNDTYGHVIGDKVLKAVSNKLDQSLKHDYFLARYGGEEFVMILPNVSVSKAQSFANRVREEISKITFLLKGNQIKITISCGIAVMHEKDTAESLLERADKALYEAKNNGRNCVEINN